MSKLRDAAAAAEKDRGGKPSPDLEMRTEGIYRHPHLREGYINLVAQPVADAKSLASSAVDYIKGKASGEHFNSPLDRWQRQDRAQRDLGGPRTPPYQGGK